MRYGVTAAFSAETYVTHLVSDCIEMQMSHVNMTAPGIAFGAFCKCNNNS